MPKPCLKNPFSAEKAFVAEAGREFQEIRAAGLECANWRVYTYVHVPADYRRRAQSVMQPLEREREIDGDTLEGDEHPW